MPNHKPKWDIRMFFSWIWLYHVIYELLYVFFDFCLAQTIMAQAAGPASEGLGLTSSGKAWRGTLLERPMNAGSQGGGRGPFYKAAIVVKTCSKKHVTKTWHLYFFVTCIVIHYYYDFSCSSWSPSGKPAGSFSIRIQSGLVRLGVCFAGADVDNLGTDLQGFGYGGTGKTPSTRDGDYWEQGDSPFHRTCFFFFWKGKAPKSHSIGFLDVTLDWNLNNSWRKMQFHIIFRGSCEFSLNGRLHPVASRSQLCIM